MDGGGRMYLKGKVNRKEYKVRIHPWNFALSW